MLQSPRQFFEYVTAIRAPELAVAGDQIRLEQHCAMIDHSALLAAIMSFNAIFATILIHSWMPGSAINYWCGLQLFLSVLLLLDHMMKRGRKRPAKVSGRYLNKCENVGWLYGAAWASVPFFLSSDAASAAIIAGLVTPPMMAGTAAVLPSNPRIVLRYGFSAACGLVGFGLFTFILPAAVVGVMSIVFCAALYIGVSRTFSAYVTSHVRSADADALDRVVRGALRAAGKGFAVVDYDGKVLYSNEEHTRIAPHQSDGPLEVGSTNFVLGERQFVRTIREVPGVGFVVIHDDKTELYQRGVELEAAVIEAEKANASKDEFLRQMARDLKAPLEVVRACVSVMSSDSNIPYDEATSRRYCDTALGSANALSERLTTIFEYVEAGAKEIFISEDYFDIANVVGQTVDVYRERFTEQEVRLVLDVDEAVGFGRGNADGAGRIIKNLLSNALEAPGTSRIVVKCSRIEGGDILVLVRDNGCGLSPDQLERVFDPFVRLYRTPTEQDQNPRTGLGLTIASKIATAAGGSVKLISHPCEGTTAVFKIRPISNDEVATLDGVPNEPLLAVSNFS